jgi:hypothetical protein
MGLTNPNGAGVKPYAVVQLRQDNRLGTLFNMVGFQTKLKHGEQIRIFRTIPGLERAEFARLGGLHRNTFLNSPKLLDASLRLFSEHHCDFDAGRATTYGGLKILGTRPESIEGRTVSFNWFDFGITNDTRDTDLKRYRLMGNGDSDSTDTIQTSCDAAQGGANDPVELISVGPYPILLPGDSLTFVVAVVEREGMLSIDSLLAYSSVCGTRLDTVPLPGDVTEETLARIIGDMAVLAVKWNKPLTARLQPVHGRKAGEMSEFDDPFLVNAKLQPVR